MISYRYCPQCAAELATRRITANDGLERRVCSACGFTQWGNSKPTASAIVVDERGWILLALRGIEPFFGMWDIPGGFLEAAEHPEDGVRREIAEETGLDVTIIRLVGVYMDTYGPLPSEDTLNLYYECCITGGTLKADDDAAELRWCDPNDFPGPLAFENARLAMADWKQYRSHGKSGNE